MEELDSEDVGTQGMGLVNRRYPSDSLQSTGADTRRDGRSRRAHDYQHSEDDSTEEDTDEDSEQDTEDDESVAAREKEDMLAESALARIRRAQEKGKQDVRLSKKELAALESRRKRLEAEARQRKTSGGSDKKRRKEQRVAVPLSQFDVSTVRPRRSLDPSRSDDALPRHPSPATVNARGPQMGLFPPPNASRSRLPSTASSSRTPPAAGSSSPFEYSYLQPPSNQRNVSGLSSRASSSQLPYPDDDVDRRSSSSRLLRDPFLYQTTGSPASYSTGAVAARRSMFESSGGVSYPNVSRGSLAASGMDDDESGDTDSDDQGHGAHIGRHSPTGEDAIMVEEASPPTPPGKSKHKTRSSTRSEALKRKPVSGGGSNSGGRTRKAKS